MQLGLICTPCQILFVLIKSGRSRRLGDVARLVEMRNAYKILIRKSEGRGQLRRYRCD